MRVFKLNPLPSQHLRCKRKRNISTTFPVIVTSIYILLLTGCYTHVQSKTPAKPSSEQPWFPEPFPSEIHNQYFVLMPLTYAFRGENECLASGKIKAAFRHLAWATLDWTISSFHFLQGKPALSRDDFNAVFDHYDAVWRRLLLRVCGGVGGEEWVKANFLKDLLKNHPLSRWSR